MMNSKQNRASVVTLGQAIPIGYQAHMWTRKCRPAILPHLHMTEILKCSSQSRIKLSIKGNNKYFNRQRVSIGCILFLYTEILSVIKNKVNLISILVFASLGVKKRQNPSKCSCPCLLLLFQNVIVKWKLNKCVYPAPFSLRIENSLKQRQCWAEWMRRPRVLDHGGKACRGNLEQRHAAWRAAGNVNSVSVLSSDLPGKRPRTAVFTLRLLFH